MSQIVVVTFPEKLSISILFEKILSIRVCERGVTLKGEEMYGKRKFECILSKSS